MRFDSINKLQSYLLEGGIARLYNKWLGTSCPVVMSNGKAVAKGDIIIEINEKHLVDIVG